MKTRAMSHDWTRSPNKRRRRPVGDRVLIFFSPYGHFAKTNGEEAGQGFIFALNRHIGPLQHVDARRDRGGADAGKSAHAAQRFVIEGGSSREIFITMGIQN